MKTLEKPVTREKKTVDPSKFNPKIYFKCVKNTATMSPDRISHIVDTGLAMIDTMGIENMEPDFLEELAIYGYLAARQR